MENLPKETVNCKMNMRRLTSLEEEMKGLNGKMDINLERDAETHEVLAKLDTVVTFMAEDRKEQKEINKGFISTLGEINTNMTQLNTDLKYVIEDNKDIKSKMAEASDRQVVESNKTKIDWTILVTRAIETLVVGGIVGAIVYLLNVAI